MAVSGAVLKGEASTGEAPAAAVRSTRAPLPQVYPFGRSTLANDPKKAAALFVNHFNGVLLTEQATAAGCNRRNRCNLLTEQATAAP